MSRSGASGHKSQGQLAVLVGLAVLAAAGAWWFLSGGREGELLKPKDLVSPVEAASDREQGLLEQSESGPVDIAEEEQGRRQVMVSTEQGDEQIQELRTIELKLKLDRTGNKRSEDTGVEIGWCRRGPGGGAYLDSEPLTELRLQPRQEREVELDVPAEALSVWVRAKEPGYIESKSFWSVQSRDRVTCTVKVSQGATLRGQLTTATGIPPVRGTSKVYPSKGKSLGGRLQGDGQFEAHFRGSGPATVKLDGLEQGSGWLALDELLEADPPQDVRIELTPGSVLGGTLVDDTDRPLPGTQVLVVTPSKRGTYERRSKTLRGRYLGVAEDGRQGDWLTTDAEGRFLAEGLIPGPVAVLARRDGSGSWSLLDGGEVTTGKRNHRFVLGSRRLSVRLRKPEGGYAIFDPNKSIRPTVEEGVLRPLQDGLRLRLAVADKGVKRSSFKQRWYRTEDPTRWEVSVRMQVPYELSASSVARPATQMRVSLSASETLREVELLLAAERLPGRVELTVLDPPGMKPVSEYLLRLEDDRGRTVLADKKVSRGSIPASSPFLQTLEVPPGSYTLTVKTRGARGASPNGAEYTPGPGSAVLQVAAGGRQQVTVETRAIGAVRAFGFDLPAGSVLRLIDARGQEIERGYAIGTTSGLQLWATPAPGSYQLVAEVPDGTVRESLEVPLGRKLSRILENGHWRESNRDEVNVLNQRSNPW